MKRNRSLLKIALFFFVASLVACTYSVNLVHTEGEAEDVVDETQRADADIKPNLTIPAI